jgi:hypothetical protein
VDREEWVLKHEGLKTTVPERRGGKDKVGEAQADRTMSLPKVSLGEE